MKHSFSLIAMAIAATFVCGSFVSCNNDSLTPDELAEEKYITVGFNCIGEYLDITNSPLTKAAGDDVYNIQVHSIKETSKTDGYTYHETIPYAYGRFETSLDNITIKLLEGQQYKFTISIAVGKSYGEDNPMGMYDKEFHYDTSWSSNPEMNIERIGEAFYGELSNYTPVEGESVTINTKRVCYGANFIAENLTEGSLDISVGNNHGGSLYNLTLTPTSSSSDKIYSFSNILGAWRGIEVPTGDYDETTKKEIFEFVNYYSVKTISINWRKSEDNIIPLGSYDITFHRNVRTTIRIKAEELASSKGITVTREDVVISDDENEYKIEGGNIVEVPLS